MNTLKTSTLKSIAKIMIFLFLALIPAAKIFATAQMPDKLIYEGKEHALHTNPLEEYFSKHEDKWPKPEGMITSLWRGYVATFEVKDGWLFVREINLYMGHDRNTDKMQWKNVIGDIFKDSKDRRLDWFSGLLVLPQGKVINYVHMGYASTFENYILLEISNGKILKEKKLSGEAYSIFKKKQFELFKQTDEYKKQVKELTENGKHSKAEAERFLEIYVIEYSKKILAD